MLIVKYRVLISYVVALAVLYNGTFTVMHQRYQTRFQLFFLRNKFNGFATREAFFDQNTERKEKKKSKKSQMISLDVRQVFVTASHAHIWGDIFTVKLALHNIYICCNVCVPLAHLMCT